MTSINIRTQSLFFNLSEKNDKKICHVMRAGVPRTYASNWQD
jgi:hypothetical protein